MVANSSTNFTITTAHQPGVQIQTLLVEDLVAWSEYHIVVIPRAGGSSGPSSNTIVVQTLASVIENPVEDLAAEILSISEVYLSWNPPHMVESNGLLEGFQVVKEMLPEEAQIVSQHSNPGKLIWINFEIWTEEGSIRKLLSPDNCESRQLENEIYVPISHRGSSPR